MTHEGIDPLAILKRRMVWDIVPCDQVVEIMPKVGLLPGSEGGNDFEHKQSHRRLNALAGVHSTILALGEVAGEIVGRVILESQENGFSDDIQKHELEQYVRVIQQSCTAVIANMVDSGSLHLGASHGE